MKENLQYYQAKIESYLLNKLSDNDKMEFVEAMNAFPQLKEEVSIRQIEFAVSEELIAEKIRNQFKAIQSEQEYKPEEVPFYSKYAWLIWSVLVIILLIGSYFLINRTESFDKINPLAPKQDTLNGIKDNPQTPNLNRLKQSSPKLDKGLSPISPQRKAKLLAIAKEFYRSPEMDALRTDNSGTEGPITKAQKAWTDHDLKKVITILETVDEKDPRYLNAQLLLGHAYYQTRNYQKAKYSFNIVKQKNIMPYSEEAEWNILITLVAQHKVRTPYFKKHLDKIIKDAGHSYNAQAIALEEKLK